jgi:carboxypeptidase C (cathepsin A)
MLHQLYAKGVDTYLSVIYIDQPIGVGFSHGTLVANSTDSAAPFLWEAFQVLFSSEEFKQFQNRE